MARRRSAPGRLLGAFLGLALACACSTTRESQPVGLDLNAVILRSEPLRAWRLASQDRTLGYVVLFADSPAANRPERTVYSVRNPWQQEIGTIDGLGRAWRFVPHQREAQWLESGTVLGGARAILAAPAEATFEEIPLEAIGGSSPQSGSVSSPRSG